MTGILSAEGQTATAEVDIERGADDYDLRSTLVVAYVSRIKTCFRASSSFDYEEFVCHICTSLFPVVSVSSCPSNRILGQAQVVKLQGLAIPSVSLHMPVLSHEHWNWQAVLDTSVVHITSDLASANTSGKSPRKIVISAPSDNICETKVSYSFLVGSMKSALSPVNSC